MNNHPLLAILFRDVPYYFEIESNSMFSMISQTCSQYSYTFQCVDDLTSQVGAAGSNRLAPTYLGPAYRVTLRMTRLGAPDAAIIENTFVLCLISQKKAAVYFTNVADVPCRTQLRFFCDQLQDGSGWRLSGSSEDIECAFTLNNGSDRLGILSTLFASRASVTFEKAPGTDEYVMNIASYNGAATKQTCLSVTRPILTRDAAQFHTITTDDEIASQEWSNIQQKIENH